ncbi:MAG: carboxypeptidase regulatory-like domain-containing protein [Deltaproteobacteria bacterium]|nr:carboxypeptidase regulatory-like domain-containing protein [Deltaproteobacteria bacterium]
MKRAIGAALAIGAILVIVLLRCRSAAPDVPATAPGASTAGSSPHARATAPTRDPRQQPRGRITGAVRARGGGPIAARVCATWSSRDLGSEETRAPVCADAGADGRYALVDLAAGDYRVHAMAPRFVPAAWRAANRADELHLRAGETRADIDLELDGDAVEVRGVVVDVNGGPIGGALVTTGEDGWWSASPAGGFVRSADDGTFTLWAKAGTNTVRATADGYAPGARAATAPGTFVEVQLTPEAVLAGTVVDATSHAPIAGALVQSRSRAGDSAITDAAGRFRITGLVPGRYKPRATAAGGYGEAAESVLLALGQTVDGVTIELHPAAVVSGKVELEPGLAPCTHGSVSLREPASGESHSSDLDADGTVAMQGVLPGTYQVTIECTDHLARDQYPPVVVAAADVVGLRWPVSDGGAITGRVHTRDGQPLAEVWVRASTTGGDPRAQRSWASQRSARDGSFTLAGLVAGSYEVHASPEDLPEPRDPARAVVAIGAVATVDIAIDPGATITGTVVDEHGAPVKDATVEATGPRWTAGGRTRTADDGTFTMHGVAVGELRVTASRGWESLRAPGATDDDTPGTRVTTTAGGTVTVALVVESQRGTIRGAVVDAQGQPVADAYVNVAREPDSAGAAKGSAVRDSRWSWDHRPVVTATDGTFTIVDLAPGNYTVRADRRGGGEAVAEHVPVLGRAQLVMKPGGAITGTVVGGDGAPLDRFDLAVIDRLTGFRRRESYYQTAGAFALRDLPAGTFTLTATATGAEASVDLALADGEHEDGVRIEVVAMVAVRGRLVELGTGAPAPGLAVAIASARGGGTGFASNADAAHANVSDAAGRFELARAPRGRAMLTMMPTDWDASPYGLARALVVVGTGPGVIDLGDVEVARSRLKPRDRPGDLGFDLADDPADAEPDARVLKVAHLDAGGPASATGLAVGDVIVAVDGTDVRAARYYLSRTLLRVPTGGTVALTLARGPTITITAGKPE